MAPVACLEEDAKVWRLSSQKLSLQDFDVWYQPLSERKFFVQLIRIAWVFSVNF